MKFPAFLRLCCFLSFSDAGDVFSRPDGEEHRVLQTKDSITRNTLVFSFISDPKDTGNLYLRAYKTRPITHLLTMLLHLSCAVKMTRPFIVRVIVAN